MRKEKNVHKAICEYLKYQYPKIYFMSDPSGLKMSIGMATDLKRTRSKHKQLDIVVLEPSGNYHGLVLEVKKDRSEVYRKDGTFKKSVHVDEQNESIEHLREKGYKVEYAFGFEHGVSIIDTYLALNINVK